MLLRLILYLSISLLATTIIAQETASSHNQHHHDDQHLHESQIPPPSQQPSQEDIKKILTNLFTKIDKNNDDTIEQDELKQWLDKLHADLINENVEQQWQYYQPPIQEVHSWESYDPEKREALPWDHYLNLTYAEEVIKAYRDNVKIDDYKSEDPNFKSYFTMLLRAETRWKAADKNNDTVLVKEEFKYFLHPEESESTKHLLVEEAMDDMDEDKNKEITLEEYIKHMKVVTPEEDKKDPAFLSTHQSQFETYLDKNKDGNICMNELTEWLLPSYDRHEAEAARMVQATDENQNQKLDKDELLKNDQFFLSLIPGEMWREFPISGDGSTTPSSHDEF